MEKVNFNKEETRNLLKMLQSKDSENHVIALQAIENNANSDYLSELVLLYKFGITETILWIGNAPKAWALLEKHFPSASTAHAVSSGSCLSIMLGNNASNAALELYFECFVEQMKQFLDQLNYPTEKFEINIKLKENG
jgi:hypothetical protein